MRDTIPCSKGIKKRKSVGPPNPSPDCMKTRRGGAAALGSGNLSAGMGRNMRSASGILPQVVGVPSFHTGSRCSGQRLRRLGNWLVLFAELLMIQRLGLHRRDAPRTRWAASAGLREIRLQNRSE